MQSHQVDASSRCGDEAEQLSVEFKKYRMNETRWRSPGFGVIEGFRKGMSKGLRYSLPERK